MYTHDPAKAWQGGGIKGSGKPRKVKRKVKREDKNKGGARAKKQDGQDANSGDANNPVGGGGGGVMKKDDDRVRAPPAGGVNPNTASWTHLGSRHFLEAPGSVPTSGPGMVSGVVECLGLITELNGVQPGSRPGRQLLDRTADACARWLADNNCKFPCMLEIERWMNLPKVHTPYIVQWFGNVNRFGRTDQPAEINEGGVPIQIEGRADIAPALRYGNHSSADQHAKLVRTAVHEDVALEPEFVIPHWVAESILGLRLSPLGLVVSATKHALSTS